MKSHVKDAGKATAEGKKSKDERRGAKARDSSRAYRWSKGSVAEGPIQSDKGLGKREMYPRIKGESRGVEDSRLIV